jgi:4-amino-4-deoxy-L-arabinose transferase-like glycosyltransferase
MLNRIPKVLCALVLAALIVRLVFAGAVLGLHAPFRGDESDYHAIASNLAAGHGFVKHIGIPTAARPPFYPLALAAVYKVFGADVVVGRLFQVLLGTLIVPLTYLLARRIFSRGVALLAAAISAFNPFLIFISGYLLTENLYTVLLLLAMILLTDAARSGFASGGRLVGAALLLGTATLTRPHALLFGLLAVLPILFRGGRLGNRVAGAALVLVTIAAVMAPWVIRNDLRLGSPILTTTHGGMTFYESNNQLILDEPAFRGAVVVPKSAVPGYDRLEGLGEVEFDREARRMGVEFVTGHPGVMPKILAWKFLRYWRFKSDVGLSGIKSGFWWDKEKSLGALASTLDVGFIYNIVVIPSFLLGLLLTLRRWREMIFLHANILVHTVMALMFYGSLRARIPIEPVLAIWAAVALAWLLGRITRRPVPLDGP